MGGNKLNLNLVAKAFDSRLSQEALFILILLAITAVFFNTIKAKQLKRSTRQDSGNEASKSVYTDSQQSTARSLSSVSEASFSKILRIGFGLLWVLDGLLQMQSSMSIELPNSVILPSEAGSPTWVKEIVQYTLTTWQRHPITYATGVAWIQLGIGLLILIAPKGFALSIAGAFSVLWAISVWVFGESLGGILAPHPSWLFGTPGAALIYLFAGIMLFLPDGYFDDPRHRRRIAKSVGIYFLIMLIIQIWPSNNYWGFHTAHHRINPLAQDVLRMAQMNQPTWLRQALVSFASFVSHEAWTVNLVVSLVLGLSALSFLLPYRRLRHHVFILQSVLMVFSWVFFQDLGFIGGVGTDPNSMMPTLIIVSAVYVLEYGNLINFSKADFFAKLSRLYPVRQKSRISISALATGGITESLSDLTIAKASSSDPAGLSQLTPSSVAENPSIGDKFSNIKSVWQRLKEKPLSTLLRLFMSVEATGVIALGALPIAIDMGNPSVSPLVAEAYVGVPYKTDSIAQNFTLVNQNGDTTSLSQYRHKKLIFLVFLDPVCTSACPLIAQEVKKTDMLLAAQGRFVEFIAIDANPLYRSTAYLDAFDTAEQMNTLSNWEYLTGGKKALNNIWNNYGISVSYASAGAMVIHSEVAYVINPDGKIVEILNDSPVYGNHIVKASFASMFYDAISKYLPQNIH